MVSLEVTKLQNMKILVDYSLSINVLVIILGSICAIFKVDVTRALAVPANLMIGLHENYVMP